MTEPWLAVICTLFGLTAGTLTFGGLLFNLGRRQGLQAGYRSGFRDGLRHAASREFAEDFRELREAFRKEVAP